MTIEQIKKKHKIPLSEQIYHITIKKLPHEIGEDGKDFWEVYLREPTLEEEENLLTIMSKQILTATKMALQSLFLEGDEEFIQNKNLIKASMSFIGQLFDTQEAIIEKK